MVFRNTFIDGDTGMDIPKPTIFFNGSSSYINFGSDESIDDLNAGDFTVECWHRPLPVLTGFINNMFDKNWGGEYNGWAFEVYEDSYLYGTVIHETQNAVEMGRTPTFTTGSWHHMAMVFNSVTKDARVTFDGTWSTVRWAYQLGIGDPVQLESKWSRNMRGGGKDEFQARPHPHNDPGRGQLGEVLRRQHGCHNHQHR